MSNDDKLGEVAGQLTILVRDISGLRDRFNAVDTRMDNRYADLTSQVSELHTHLEESFTGYIRATEPRLSQLETGSARIEAHLEALVHSSHQFRSKTNGRLKKVETGHIKRAAVWSTVIAIGGSLWALATCKCAEAWHRIQNIFNLSV